MSKNKDLAVVAISGGMDSCVTAAIANENHRLAFVHINYGQRTERRELKAYNDIAEFYGVKERLVIDFTHLSKIGGSSTGIKCLKPLTVRGGQSSRCPLDFNRRGNEKWLAIK